MNTTIEYIKSLREITGAGILECRQALEGNNYSYEVALAVLREQSASRAAGKTDRETPQGAVKVYAHNGGRIGVMLEVNCETDFTARSERFRGFVHELILQIAAETPRWVAETDVPADVLEQERIRVVTRARAEGKPESLHPRICVGALQKFMNRNVLLRQAFIRDESVTVAQLLTQTAGAVGENVVIRRFVRWELADWMDKATPPSS